ncbi:nucleotidyltransferase domain-containing protein [Photorhabdus heterorhabditis]|uniref:Nucleotidyltransferase n=1 Tax=Photorhabdus heterorhabditis TaxID=880156 RepID=A0A5B0W528_9GAMM|nr:nucleotidyltransferase domain-containing protein [Photorhabdus heterorhabditis]KAA1182080.1 nucleotidyltransferase domain-containing protein [Photorhabdus heterorhabditis]KOY62520.1 nucleotidyltransferase [Photorhabdus heterorhabditis]MBS9443777.1 nucleotidyltransferase domain-containing protein [Photorhabdus heterorhabditis]
MKEKCGVSDTMKQHIRQKLAQLETEQQIRILYACESGSRGWGFASTNSDYDVRFIYVHDPSWYLRVDPPRDVIELPINDELDISGWELRKTLGLLKRANPTLMEWTDSPVVYCEDVEFMTALRALLPDYFSNNRARYHYLSMAKKNFRGHLQGKEIRLKKYLYVLRPLLAVRWIEAGKGAPPMRFDALLAATVENADLMREIQTLLTIKRNASETDYGPRFKHIHNFICHELDNSSTRCKIKDERFLSDTKLDLLLMHTVFSNNTGGIC